jgi:transglutaminase-like putative cysteine protease
VDEARARRKAEPSADLAQSSFVPVEIDEGAAARGGLVVYRMIRASGSWEGTELEDARQKVVTREAGTVVLEVRRGELPKGPAAGAAAAPAELLKATPYLETDSPEVRRALREALGAEAGIREMRAEEAARRLALWVRDHVDERTLDVGFATAAEVARDRRGDCTEHAVLLAAMLRAAGIASRVRAGLLYVGGGFGYHLWTQAWLGGGWVDLDPSLGDGPVDPLHIGLATSDLGNESPLLGIAALGPLVGDLRIEVVEIGGGAPAAPPRPEAPRDARPGPR